jgi:hypothetical protein
LDGFFGLVEEDKEVVSSRFTEGAVLSANEVIPAPAAGIVRMRGFNPRLTGFDLYGAAPGRDDVEDGRRVYGNIKD